MIEYSLTVLLIDETEPEFRRISAFVRRVQERHGFSIGVCLEFFVWQGSGCCLHRTSVRIGVNPANEKVEGDGDSIGDCMRRTPGGSVFGFQAKPRHFRNF